MTTSEERFDLILRAACLGILLGVLMCLIVDLVMFDGVVCP